MFSQWSMGAETARGKWGCGNRLVPFAAVLLSAMPSAARETKALIASSCMERSGGVTSQMLDCLARSYETIDDELNQAWSGLLPALEASQQERFRNAQRIWIDYRDTTCAAEAALQTGSFASVALADCRVRLSAERLRWLKDVLPEQDLVQLWQSVVSAATADEQEHALSAFLTAVAVETGKPLTYSLTATSVDRGSPVSIGDGVLLDDPFAHMLHLSIDGKIYHFRPHSPQIVTRLLRE
ncbi:MULTISPECIES: lysozyme inhibitor LprI family protein [Rhizobium]|uniref:lysozyme inhibitor LprI family protein n=1 Tax=Rhizobium TaxID=379 RepID=UPI000712762C|nr:MULTISPECIES: lysozyme inhibitor LprI family protein [Rhizobium]KQO79522.1 hypothetical protein ASF29_22830 [Rhizobium sp. Leaf262]NTF34079.1 DUF1311 domain-containing protein [Rhizobium skierniewicense]